MVIEIIVGIAAFGTVIGPATAILATNTRLKKELAEAERLRLEERTLFFEKGKAVALAEVAKIKEDRGVSFRDAAKIAGHQCAHCSRKCLHCAREAKAEGEIDLSRIDSADALDFDLGRLLVNARQEEDGLENESVFDEIDDYEPKQNKRAR